MPLTLNVGTLSTVLTRVDDVNGFPSFVCSMGPIYHDGVNWNVADIAHSMHSTATHPHTVYGREWSQSDVFFHVSGGLSATDPLCLESDLGLDIFYRLCPMTRPVWYRSPSGCVTHSGAKQIQGVMGRRWCSVCKRGISGNNFVFQHMRKMHPDGSNEWELFCAFIS